jgi:hypothetical protein
MQGTIGSYFNLYSFTPGRRLFALGQVRERAQGRGEEAIAGLCGEGIAVDTEAVNLARRWQGTRKVNEGARVEASEVDIKLDRTVSAIHSMLGTEASAFAGEPRGDAAETLMMKLYPDGVSPIVHSSHENQLATVDEMVSAFRGEFAPQVETLGMGHFVDRAAALADEFRSALGRSATREVSFDQVREARERGQEAMLRVFAAVLGRFNSSSESDTEARADLLGPIIKQNQRIGEYHSRRRRAPDVNGDTGEELEFTPTDEMFVAEPAAIVEP